MFHTTEKSLNQRISYNFSVKFENKQMKKTEIYIMKSWTYLNEKKKKKRK